MRFVERGEKERRTNEIWGNDRVEEKKTTEIRGNDNGRGERKIKLKKTEEFIHKKIYNKK